MQGITDSVLVSLDLLRPLPEWDNGAQNILWSRHPYLHCLRAFSELH